MNRNVTIVMYHFVRDLVHSRYPEIKGLTVEGFKGQIDYIKRHYNIIKMQDLIAAISSKDLIIPPRAVLLTFDDGYIDHYTNVFPLLSNAGLQGSFFPSARAIEDYEVLDVNKIHFILASVQDKSAIIKSIFTTLDESRRQYNLNDNNTYYSELAVPNRFDSADVIFIKRMLQWALPEDLRIKITNSLFKKFVTKDESAFSTELYMNIDQLICMKQNGMFIGNHCYNHRWMDKLTTEEQIKEVDMSLQFLQKIGVGEVGWVMCYPYGAYNESMMPLLKARGCVAGLSVEVRIADLDQDNPLALPRLDTNDLPKTGDLQPNEWTMKAGGWA